MYIRKAQLTIDKEKSNEIIRAGERAQDEFVSVICRGFSDDELNTLKNYIQRMTGNINEYLDDHNYKKGGSHDQ